MVLSRKKRDFDIIIVGGGLAGLSMANLLNGCGLSCLCLDSGSRKAQLAEPYDGRTTAISYGSQKILEKAGVWKTLLKNANPIEQIDILDGSQSPNYLEFNTSEVGGNVFGWIIENRLIRQALLKNLDRSKNVTYQDQATVSALQADDEQAKISLSDGTEFTAQLIIGADGRRSFVRSASNIDTRAWSYKQKAIVCAVTHQNPHNNIAVEHFRREGPFAVLPMCDTKDGKPQSSVVWTEHGPEKESAYHYSQESFDAALTERFPDRYGAVQQIGKRYRYPLSLSHAHDYIAPRTALIAEAAHGIHPIAGQGLNMGFRDIAALTELLNKALESGDDIGGNNILDAYQQKRRFDNMAMAGATDTLNRLFSNDFLPVRAVRKLGMRIISRTDFAKQFFMKQAMGAGGVLPALIKDQAA